MKHPTPEYSVFQIWRGCDIVFGEPWAWSSWCCRGLHFPWCPSQVSGNPCSLLWWGLALHKGAEWSSRGAPWGTRSLQLSPLRPGTGPPYWVFKYNHFLFCEDSILITALGSRNHYYSRFIGTERLTDWPKIAQLFIGEASIQIQQ